MGVASGLRLVALALVSLPLGSTGGSCMGFVVPTVVCPRRVSISISENGSGSRSSASVMVAKGGYVESLESSRVGEGGAAAWQPDVLLTLKTTSRLVLAVGSMQLFLAAGATAISSIPSTLRVASIVKKVLVYFLFGLVTFGNYKFAEVLPFTRRRPRIKNFERRLNRPMWAPKAIVFPIVWLLVKTLWTGASSLIYLALSGGVSSIQGLPAVLGVLQQPPLLMYIYHLCLADIWNDLYMREAQLGAAVTVLAALWGSFVITAKTFYEVRPISGLLYIPSIVWITVAAALSISIWSKNGKQPFYIWKADEEGWMKKSVTASENYLNKLS